MDRDIQNIVKNITSKGFLHIEERNKLEYLGFDLLSDIGTDRIVFSTGVGTVVKIARDEMAVDLNYDEVAVWEKYERENNIENLREKDELIFCPIIDSGPHYRWIEMVNCSRSPSQIQEFNEKISKTEWRINDLHADNIGILEDDNIVCYDYPDATNI